MSFTVRFEVVRSVRIGDFDFDAGAGAGAEVGWLVGCESGEETSGWVETLVAPKEGEPG